MADTRDNSNPILEQGYRNPRDNWGTGYLDGLLEAAKLVKHAGNDEAYRLIMAFHKIRDHKVERS